MVKKILLKTFVFAFGIACIALNSFAGTWIQLSDGWQYTDDAGRNPATGWKQIDGKWYYFYDNHYMAASTYTPDGYWVGADGAWAGNGASSSAASANADKNRQAVAKYRDMLIDNSWRTESREGGTFAVMDINQDGIYEVCVQAYYNMAGDSRAYNDASIFYYANTLQRYTMMELQALNGVDSSQSMVIIGRIRGKAYYDAFRFTGSGFEELDKWFFPYLNENETEAINNTYMKKLKTPVFVDITRENINRYLSGDGMATGYKDFEG